MLDEQSQLLVICLKCVDMAEVHLPGLILALAHLDREGNLPFALCKHYGASCQLPASRRVSVFPERWCAIGHTVTDIRNNQCLKSKWILHDDNLFLSRY